MSYRNGNYCAFYVAEPFQEGNLDAHGAKDFVYYNMLRMWEGKDDTFPFIDSHDKTYNVRDGSDWEKTLKPRLHQRLRHSKNIVLFLSSQTKSSRALAEEIDYGINDRGLPVIIIYPDYDTAQSLLENNNLKQSIKDLWEKLPVLRDSMSSVPTLHVPLNKDLITRALNDEGFTVNGKVDSGAYRYTS
ncbi:TIR domain-containing protein [Pantoea coffeiphila]|uniref:TIR domain-containing protein n=1 Tax=Pantoea coffeiphila TaxID=1465635 RepID=UPI001960736B|nr:TIR domain-containing protein [Pantoea coffeiphila]MBM7342046.1 hypothetical protein [Pantoea coffeiphila]